MSELMLQFQMSGQCIFKEGIEPDYVVRFTHNDFINNIDPQLAYAKKFLDKTLSAAE